MKKRRIGNTDLEIAPLNLGGNVFGWTLDEKESFKILDAFAERGFNFIDTADMYSFWAHGDDGGQSETIIGNWMKARGNRDKMIIATKVGGQTTHQAINTSKKHILTSAEKSLKRLQVDAIDLYYTHFDDGVTPVEETLEAYDMLIKAGKVRHIGASNLTPERLLASLQAAEHEGLPKYEALQPHYNLMERANYESHFAPLAEEYGMSVFPYWALASGFLTGKYRSESDLKKSVRGRDAGKYLNEKGLSVLAALDDVASKHKSTPASVSLAWLLAQENIGAPIASATSLQQLETLFAAVDMQLDGRDLELLNTASS